MWFRASVAGRDDAVVVIVVVVWLLQAFGVLGSLQNIRIR